jgi:hypothetical protein
MRYITGIHALNLNCSLETCGDWHQSALAWKNVTFGESVNSVFGDWGIEQDRDVPFVDESRKFNVANHIRALLDLIDRGDFSNAGGMNRDFICNDKYDTVIFDKVALLRDNSNWALINNFMSKEYRMKWLKYRGENVQHSIRKTSFKSQIDDSNLNNINTLCVKLSNAYIGRDRIRDLYDVCFICKNYWNELSPNSQEALRNAVFQKGFEQFDYIIATQSDELIDNDKLASDFLKAYEILDIPIDDKA